MRTLLSIPTRSRRPSPPRRSPVSAAALAAALGLLVAACGGDDGGGDAGSAAAAGAGDEVVEAAADVDDASDASAGDHGCPATELAFTNTAAGLSGTATTALARSSFDGGLYEVHVADFDLTADDLRTWRPEVPDTGNVITIQLTVFNATDDPAPIDAGASLELTTEPDVLTYLVRHFTADDDWSSAENIGVDSVGTLAVTAVGEVFCFDLDYRDQDKEVAGSVAATVFEQR